MIGVSERTVRNIVKEKDRDGFKSSKQFAPRTGVVKRVNDFDVCAIKQALYTLCMNRENK